MTGSCTAVVCEDDQVLVAALRCVLADHGFRVLAWVDCGADVLAAVREQGPALVVVDAALLGTLGVGLLAQLHAECSARVVVLSPLGLEFPAVADDSYVVVPGDDLGPLRQLLTGLVSDGCEGRPTTLAG